MQPQPPQAQQTQPEPASRRASSTCSTAPRRSSSSGIGCMAGLLRLISPYHRSHHRKRLTPRNNAAAAASAARDYSQAPPTPSSSSPPRKKAAGAAQQQQQPSASPAPSSPAVKPVVVVQHRQLMVMTTAVRRRRSCDAPRSPTIAPEHRRSSCDSPRPPPPAIIARLMGLEESAPPSPAAAAATPRAVVVFPTRPPPPPPPAPAHPETAAEKRRKLLGALEKCDEDLKTLRRIIAAVRGAEMRAASASDVVCTVAATTTPAGNKGANNKFGRDDEHSPSPPTQQQQQQYKLVRTGEQQLYRSPDSVLDAISSPRFPCRKRPSPCTDLDVGGCGNGALAPTAVGPKIVKPSRTLVFSGDYYCKQMKSGGDELPLVVGTPRSAGAESWRHHRRRWEQEAAAAGRVISRATAESVGEAIMWVRQQQGLLGDDECGRVAAALERAIVQDLVADLVAELQAQAGSGRRGVGGCRKRLCF